MQSRNYIHTTNCLRSDVIVSRHVYDTHTLVNSLHVLHHLIETAHEVGAVDLGQGGVVPAEGLGLVDELLPAGVAGEQGPLFPPAEKRSIKTDIVSGE